MGFYDTHILPRLLNVAMNTKALREERQRCLAGVTGTVLEIGFGTGLNLPHYPATVTKVVGVDPSATSAKLAARRRDVSPFPVETVGLSAETIPVADASFDAAVSTFTLCTIPDVGAALREMRRAVRPGGHFYFVEHGLANEPAVRRWQHRLNPLQKKLFGGCHLTRDIGALVAQAGFEIEHLENGYLSGAPKFGGFLYRGVARRPNG